MAFRLAKLILVITVVLSISLSSYGQSKPATGVKTKKIHTDSLMDRVTKAREDLIKATDDYKASLEKLISFHEADIKAASTQVEKHKELFSAGVISRRELENSEHALTAAESKLSETRRQMAEADILLAEAKVSEQMLKLQADAFNTSIGTGVLIRYDGHTKWVVTEASKIESYYTGRFGKPLPISAFGQTALHDRLGFDHRNAIDVAVHPDSKEGQELMAYLRSMGIPFLAFRQEVPGSSTGAHIHIGLPSHRFIGNR